MKTAFYGWKKSLSITDQIVFARKRRGKRFLFKESDGDVSIFLWRKF